MARKSMAGKTPRTCVGAKVKKIIISLNFKFEIALNSYLDKFLTWISLHLPEKLLNAFAQKTIYNRNELLKHPE